jgi:hypothetical protein
MNDLPQPRPITRPSKLRNATTINSNKTYLTKQLAKALKESLVGKEQMTDTVVKLTMQVAMASTTDQVVDASTTP